jgi:prolipoprotein diacylglyceryltransferase
MRPVLFQWRGVKVRSYAAMLYLGLVTGVLAGNAAAHSAGIDAFRVVVATMVLLVPALVGARLFYVATHWQLYRGNPRRIWDRSEGGAAQYGGIAVALPLSAPLVHALHLSWGEFWDAAVFTILAGMILVRIGCLLNGCCAGRLSESWLGVSLPDVRGVWARRIPTQLLEAGWAAVLLVFAIPFRERLPFPGALFWIVAAGYGAGRLVLESTREAGPADRRFTVHHAISAALILLSLAVLASHWPKISDAVARFRGGT